ncbi:hypothetical protein [Nocardioides alcanivorans]|uniref:hypothetical protein n=1 Tax=Nocardioides alcanivorans TaxID=2897352 RepID=UPI001F2A4AE9|nr:hypothetical protein [Nocardioides alcanivorans]
MSRAWLVGFVAVLMMATGCSSDGWTASSAPAPGEVLTEENFASTVVGAMVAAGTVQATMRTPEKLTTGQVRLGDQPAMRLSTGQGLARQETIVVDDHAYLRHGIGKFRELLDDESDEIDEIQRHFATNLVLELLAANHLEPDQFRHLGEEHIGNTPYERYALVFQREWVDEVFASEQQLPRMSFRFWLDEQHRVRRLLFTMYGEDFVADFSAWGHEVSIEAPAASEVLPAGSYVPLTRSTFAAATAGPEEGEVTFRMDMVTSDGMEMHGDIRGDGQKVLALDATYVEEGESFEALYVDRTFYARPTGRRSTSSSPARTPRRSWQTWRALSPWARSSATA